MPTVRLLQSRIKVNIIETNERDKTKPVRHLLLSLSIDLFIRILKREENLSVRRSSSAYHRLRVGTGHATPTHKKRAPWYCTYCHITWAAVNSSRRTSLMLFFSAAVIKWRGFVSVMEFVRSELCHYPTFSI